KRYRPRDLWASDAESRQLTRFARADGVGRAPDHSTLVAESELIVLAVKPQVMQAVLTEVRAQVTRRQLFVSIAAGIPTARLEHGLGGRVRVVRAMPNTPALVGHAVTVVVRGAHATAADERRAADLFGGDCASVRAHHDSPLSE